MGAARTVTIDGNNIGVESGPSNYQLQGGILSDVRYDVPQQQYPTIIRELIRHENDLTNHRIMWLLIGQGFIANAYVSAKVQDAPAFSMFGLVGMLIAVSAFVMLYRSYQARCYLQFLGQQAKQGALREQQLPLTGWPINRIKDWWRNEWVCRWFMQARDLVEPWLLLPFIFTSMWITGPLYANSGLNAVVALTVGVVLSAVILSLSCITLVWSQAKDDSTTEE
jgi:hypothetical protein